MKIPHLIALCGHPGSGKTEVQNILHEAYGVQQVDDGAPVRDFAMRHLGLHWNDVHTQEGKMRSTMVSGGEWQNRQILGELANRLEEMFGSDIMPYMATRKLNEYGCYSFGSVRREQGWYYKAQGGVVLGVRRPGVLPSGNEFDLFDEEAIDFWIENDGDLENLKLQIEVILHRCQWTPMSFKLVA